MASGTFGEKTLHAAIKAYLCPDPSCHEVEIGCGIADIVQNGQITEVQTGSFFALRKKLDRYFSHGIAHVRVVCPLIRRKWICRTDTQSGEVTRRKSPKQGKPWDAAYELIHFLPYLCDARVELVLLETDIEEYQGEKKTHRAPLRLDRVPLSFGEEIPLNAPQDFLCMLSDSLGESFSVKEYKALTKFRDRRARASLGVLCHVGVIRCEKQGNRNVYTVAVR